MKLYKQPGSKNWWAVEYVSGKRYRKSMGTADKRKAQRKAHEWAASIEERRSDLPEINLTEAIKMYLDHCKDYSLAKSTLKDYRRRLNTFQNHVGDIDACGLTPEQAFTLVADFLQHRVRVDELTDDTNERVVIGSFFNYLRYRRWYHGQNPCDAKLHKLRRPRKPKKINRCMSPEEDLIIRREGPKYRIWPVLLLCRWAGMRRGEVCALNWDEVGLKEGYVDVVGHEGGRKHPRRVWLSPWIVLQLRRFEAGWLPENCKWPVVPFRPETANKELAEFCKTHLDRRIGFHDLRASWVTEVFKRGMSVEQESIIGGHSPEVARKYYSEHDAREAIGKLPPDPLTENRAQARGADADADARLAAKRHSSP